MMRIVLRSNFMRARVLCLSFIFSVLLTGCGYLESVNAQDMEEVSYSIVSMNHYEDEDYNTIHWYAYNKLETDGKRVYKQMLYILSNQLEQEYIEGVNEKSLDLVFSSVMADHPEIYYVSGYTFREIDNGVIFEGIYDYDSERIKEYNIELENKAEEVKKEFKEYNREYLSRITEEENNSSTEYLKVKFLYEYIIKNVDYDVESEENQTIISSMLNGSSVCTGYAKMFQYLADKLGISSVIVEGRIIDGDNHMWNMVKVDGVYYYVDCTMGDAQYIMRMKGDSSITDDLICYDYMCFTTEDMEKEHEIISKIPYPVCEHIGASYYVNEYHYFSSYDIEQLLSIFDTDDKIIGLKCKNERLYNEMKESLIERGEVFLITEHEQMNYIANDKLYSIYFIFS